MIIIMDKKIISVSPVDISVGSLLSALCMDANGIDEDTLEGITTLCQAAVTVAKPTAVYLPIVPEVRDDAIWLNGIKIKEPFVYKKLFECNIVVPYVASCGTEIEAWSQSLPDFFDQFAADTLKIMCLGIIRDKLYKEVKENIFLPEKEISSLNPGSLKTWPISGQIPLFDILGGVTNDVGVELTSSLLMIPTKSSSGILFSSDQAFHNCQLCPNLDCPGRRAPYSDELH